MTRKELAHELEAAAEAHGSGKSLTPRQQLLLCLVLLRSGATVRMGRLREDLRAWIKRRGTPTPGSVREWMDENRGALEFGLNHGHRRHRATA
jgi:hypothetical protein